VAKLFSAGNQRAVTRAFIVFDRLTTCDDRRIENGFVGDLASNLVAFFQDAVDDGATRALGLLITATDVPPPLRSTFRQRISLFNPCTGSYPYPHDSKIRSSLS
jgi:hypothetical protein